MFWVIVAQFASAFGMLMVLAVNVKAIGTIGIGHLSIGLTITLIINQLLFTGPNSAVNRFIHYTDKSLVSVRSLILDTAYFQFKKVGVILFFSIIMLCIYVDVDIWMTLLCLLFGISSGVFALLNTVTNALELRKNYAIQIVFEMTLRVFLSFIAAVLFKDARLVVVALIISTLVGIYFAYSKLVKCTICDLIETKKIDQDTIVECNRYSLSFAKWGLINWAFLSFDKILIAKYFNIETAGEYSILYQLAFSPITMLISMFMVYISPRVFKSASSLNGCTAADRYVYKCLLSVLLLALPIVVVVAAIPSYLPNIFSKLPQISEYTYLFILAGVLNGSTYIVSMLLNNKKRAELIVLPRNLTAVFGVFSYYLILFFDDVSFFLLVNIIVSLIYISWILYLNREVSLANV